jgi:hypothetical protein
MKTETVLVIPPEGLLNLYHSDAEFDPNYYRHVIEAITAEGEFALLDAVIDKKEYKVGLFINNPMGAVNQRAREACAAFFGWHMVFVGPMFIAGLSMEESTRLIEYIG